MSNEGFNPEDIEDTLSRFGRGQKKTIRSLTAGIPDFVPRKAKLQSSPVESSTKDEALWAAAADRAEQQAQELPPPPALVLARLISTSFWRENRRNIR